MLYAFQPSQTSYGSWCISRCTCRQNAHSSSYEHYTGLLTQQCGANVNGGCFEQVKHSALSKCFGCRDSGSPLLNATVTRTVVVSDPCPSRNTPYFCTDSNKKSFCSGGLSCSATLRICLPQCSAQYTAADRSCIHYLLRITAATYTGSATAQLHYAWLATANLWHQARGLLHAGTPCDQAAKMLPPAKPAPQVQLLPSAGPVYIEYGKTAPSGLTPCASGTANSSCGAVAWDVAPSKRTDLTPFLSVASAPSCSTDNSGHQVHKCLHAATWYLAVPVL
jgi:hypothetical protein